MSAASETPTEHQSARCPIDGLAELELALRRIGERLTALGDAADAEAMAKRGQIYLETAGYFGYMALVTYPEAHNYVCCSIRFDGADDPNRAAIAFEARWEYGKTPDCVQRELREEIELQNAWREMKAERDAARAAGGTP
jgi:hypothetical protein